MTPEIEALKRRIDELERTAALVNGRPRSRGEAKKSWVVEIPAADFAGLPEGFTDPVGKIVQYCTDATDTRWRLSRSGILRRAISVAVILQNLGGNLYVIAEGGPNLTLPTNSDSASARGPDEDGVVAGIGGVGQTRHPVLNWSPSGYSVQQPFYPQFVDTVLQLNSAAALPIGTPIALGSERGVGLPAQASEDLVFRRHLVGVLIQALESPLESLSLAGCAVAVAGSVDIPDLTAVLATGEIAPAPTGSVELWLSPDEPGKYVTSMPAPEVGEEANPPHAISIGFWQASGDIETNAGRLYIHPRFPQIDAIDVRSGAFADERISESSVKQHESALDILWGQIVDPQAVAHALDSSTHSNVTVASKANGDALVWDETAWKNKRVITPANSFWNVKEFNLGFFGVSALICGGTPAAITAAAAGQGIGWAYTPTRYVAWNAIAGGKIALSDGITGTGGDGTDPLTYAPSATDDERELDINVKLLLQTVAGTEGQVMTVDEDGKPEWKTLPFAWTRVSLTSGTSWTVPAAARQAIVLATGGGGGAGRLTGVSYYVAATSGGSTTTLVTAHRIASGGGGGTAIGFYELDPDNFPTATIAIGAGGVSDTATDGAAGGNTTFTYNSKVAQGDGGGGGNATGGSGGSGGSASGDLTIQGGAGIGVVHAVMGGTSRLPGGSSAMNIGGGASAAGLGTFLNGSNGRIIILWR